MKNLFANHDIDYIEIYCPMAKAFAFWHVKALGFKIIASMGYENGKPGISSYVLKSGNVRLVITSTYPPYKNEYNEISCYVNQNHCGVKRIALRVASAADSFERSVKNGAFPLTFPHILEDESGVVKEASIKLYDHSELIFIQRDEYKGVFKPGYQPRAIDTAEPEYLMTFDHIASEVRINESAFWTEYLHNAIGIDLAQTIQREEHNQTGMVLNINQSDDKNLTLVIAEPESTSKFSKVQQNVDTFGPGVHHLAFSTKDLIATTEAFVRNQVDFVSFPASYYKLLRANEDFKGIDIDKLEELNILCDKIGDTYLLQKFLKPVSERPFFIYEIVQRVNGYNGFAIGNINVLKKAEELEIMAKAQSQEIVLPN